MEQPITRAFTPLERQAIETANTQSRTLANTLRSYIQAERDARHDELTGALNRRGFKKWLETAETPKALLVVDATNFKALNDKYGEGYGDNVVGMTYDVLLQSVRQQDVIARWGGDDFVIALNDDPTLKSVIETPQDRRTKQIQADYIEPVKKRVAVNVQSLLDQYEELRQENFDLAVGSIVWPGESDIAALIQEAEQEMRIHKAEQHKSGQYR